MKTVLSVDVAKNKSMIMLMNSEGEIFIDTKEINHNLEDFEKVKEIIVDSLSCDESQVTMEANLKDDLEADSLDAVELIMQIEEEFEVEIPDEVASNMKTVKDIVDYIEANK